MDIEAKNKVTYSEMEGKDLDDKYEKLNLDKTYKHDRERFKLSKLKESKAYRRFKTVREKIEKWKRIRELKSEAKKVISEIANANLNKEPEEDVKKSIHELAVIESKLNLEQTGFPYNAQTIEARAIRLEKGMLGETRRKVLKQKHKEEMKKPNIQPMTKEQQEDFKAEMAKEDKIEPVETPQKPKHRTEEEEKKLAEKQGIEDRKKAQKAKETPQKNDHRSPEEEIMAAILQGMADKKRLKDEFAYEEFAFKFALDILAAIMAGEADKNKKNTIYDIALQEIYNEGLHDVLERSGINPENLKIEDKNKYDNYVNGWAKPYIEHRTKGIENVHENQATNEENNKEFADFKEDNEKSKFNVDIPKICENIVNKMEQPTKESEEVPSDEKIDEIIKSIPEHAKHYQLDDKEETKFDKFKEKAKDFAKDRYKEAKGIAIDKYEDAKEYAEGKYDRAKDYVSGKHDQLKEFGAKVESIREEGIKEHVKNKALDKLEEASNKAYEDACRFLADQRSRRFYPETEQKIWYEDDFEHTKTSEEKDLDPEDTFDVGNESYVRRETINTTVIGDYGVALKRMLEKEEENARLNEELEQREKEIDRKIAEQEKLRAKKEAKERELHQAIFERETKADKEKARIQRREESQNKRSELLDRQVIESEESIDAIDNMIHEIRTGRIKR